MAAAVFLSHPAQLRLNSPVVRGECNEVPAQCLTSTTGGRCTWGNSHATSFRSTRAQARRGISGPDYPAPQKSKKQPAPEPEYEEFDQDEVEDILNLELQSNVEPARRHYEIMFLIHEDNFEEVPSIVKMMEEAVSQRKGVVWRLNDWGLRRLAYKIKKASKANYILMNIEVLPKQIGEVENMLLKDERIIRHLVFKMKGPETRDYPPPPEPGFTEETETVMEFEGDDDEEEEEEEEDEEEEEEGDEEEEEEEEEGVEEDEKEKEEVMLVK